MPREIVGAGDRRMGRQIVARRIEPQLIVAKLRADVRAALRPLERDGEIGLALRETDEMRHRQQIDRHARMRGAKPRELRREKEAAEPFGRSDPHVAGQRLARMRDLVARGLHGRLHRVRIGDEPLPFGRQREALRARLVEQQRAERRLQRADAPCDGRVVDAEPLRGTARPLRARHFEKEAQVVPVQLAGNRLGRMSHRRDRMRSVSGPAAICIHAHPTGFFVGTSRICA
ncbi:hypothetical protein FEP90_05655 [Burkholderia multivorans]|nr:hypothetical protein [Burkholderia multivorans]